MFAILLLIYQKTIPIIDTKIIFPILAGLCEVGGVFFFIKSLKKEGVGLSIAIASSYPLIAFLYNYFFLGERLNSIQILSIFFIILGIFILSLETFNLRKIAFNKNLIFAFLAFISWGGAKYLSKIFQFLLF